MDYLRGGGGRDHDFGTGYEEALKDWILEQPDASVDPVSLYRESLALNGGNIWNALLTIHQLLRNNARWPDPARYNYVSTFEEQGRFFNKFIDIRGDLRELGRGKKGDHGGSWYRIWGVMLARLMYADFARFNPAWNADRNEYERPQADLGDQLRHDVAQTYTRVGAWYTELKDNEVDLGKRDLSPAIVGAMGEMLKSLQWPEAVPADRRVDDAACAARAYLVEAN